MVSIPSAPDWLRGSLRTTTVVAMVHVVSATSISHYLFLT